MSQFDWKTVPGDARIRFLDEAAPFPGFFYPGTHRPRYLPEIVVEIVDGVPRRRSNWTPTDALAAPSQQWRKAMIGSYMLTTRKVTIAADGFEIHVLDGHFDGMTARPEKATKIYTVIKAMASIEVEEWMHLNLPHFVAYNTRERVDKAAERRWINKHATGQWALSSIDGGVRFAVENDAFWFKMTRT